MRGNTGPGNFAYGRVISQERRSGAAVAIVGDSLSANGLVSGRGQAGPRAWWQWAQLYSNGRFYIANVAAVGGYKTDDVLSNSIPLVVARTAWPNSNGGGLTLTPKIDIIIEACGTNDLFVAPTKTIPELLSKKMAIWQRIRAAGIEPVTTTLTPRNNATDTNTIMQYNAALVALATREGVKIVDFYTYTAEPTTGQWRAGYNISGDAVHAEELGARAMANAVVAALAMLPSNALPQLNAQNDTIMWRNSLFIGGVNFPNGPGWYKSGGFDSACTTSLNTSDASVVGNSLDIQLTVDSPSRVFVRTPAFNLAGNGKYVAVSARIKASSAGTSPSYYCSLVQSTSSGAPIVGLSGSVSTTEWLNFYSIVQLGEGFGAPCLEFGAQGVGTVLRIAQIGIFNVTDAILA